MAIAVGGVAAFGFLVVCLLFAKSVLKKRVGENQDSAATFDILFICVVNLASHSSCFKIMCRLLTTEKRIGKYFDQDWQPGD